MTYDTLPFHLDGDVDFHIYCNKNLQYIRDNPDGHCISTSTPWTTALVDNTYETLMIQPFDGTSLTQDVEIISGWMDMQPDADILLHTGWARHDQLSEVLALGNPDNMMRPNFQYFEDLVAALEVRHAGRKISSNHAFAYLAQIENNALRGIGPYDELSDIYRDQIHMTLGDGRYLMHNVVRKSLGQEFSSEGITIDSARQSYLDQILTTVPEPSTALPLAALSVVRLIRRSRRSRRPT